jgi:hypothetical protein
MMINMMTQSETNVDSKLYFERLSSSHLIKQCETKLVLHLFGIFRSILEYGKK